MTKVINLASGPGSGKSTTAAALFAKMKLRHLNVELVTEFAKQITWAHRQKELSDQAYIFAKQYHKMQILSGQVDYIVTDSPLFLSVIYCPDDYFPSFKPFVMEVFDSFDNKTFFIQRVKPYNPKGRNQTEEESNEISKQIMKFMIDNVMTNFYAMSGDEQAPDKILEVLEKDGFIN